jgi:hypothetical protein
MSAITKVAVISATEATPNHLNQCQNQGIVDESHPIMAGTTTNGMKYPHQTK